MWRTLAVSVRKAADRDSSNVLYTASRREPVADCGPPSRCLLEGYPDPRPVLENSLSGGRVPFSVSIGSRREIIERASLTSKT